MSSVKDLVKKVNEGKIKTVSAPGQKQSSKDEEEEKSSSFKDLVKSVNEGTIKVGSKLNSTEVDSWYKNVSDVGKRSYNFLSKEGYRGSDTSLMAELDKYLYQAADVAQYIRSNRDSFSNYDDTIKNHYSMVNYLRELQSGIKSSNDYFSQWDSEKSYNDFVASKKDYEAKSKFDLNAGQKEIDELKSQYDEFDTLRTQYVTAVNNPEVYTQEQRKAITDRYRELVSNYGSAEKLKSIISEKTAYLNNSKRIQNGISLAGVSENADFKQNSGYVSTARDGWWDKLTSTFGMGYDDLTYEYINGKDNGMRQEIINKAVAYDADTDDYFVYDHMTSAQIATYNYHYAKDGKEKAEQYLDSIRESLNYQSATERFEGMEGKTALELLFGIEAGADQFQSGIKNLFNTKDDYIPSSVTQMTSGMVREDLADAGPNLPDWLGGGSFGQMGYDAITTTVNMAPSIITSAVANVIVPGSGQIIGTALMGASAAGNAYQEALNLGYDKSQARAYSTLVGASEAGLQYLLGGIGKLGGKVSGNLITKLTNGIDNAFARTALKLGGNMISEGLEEGLQEVLTPWFQNLTLRMDEDVNWSEVAYSSLLGALTAGFMEGTSTISGEVSTYNTGKQLQEADISAQRLAEIGKTFAADTVAHQLAGRVNERTGAYTMGRLFNEIGATLTEQNVNDITNALVKRGMEESVARANAKAMATVVEGGNLTDLQVKIIESNEVLAEAVRTTIIDSNATWFQRSKGYNEALMALAHEKTAPDTSRTFPASQSEENAPTTDKVDTQNENGVESDTEAQSTDLGPAKVSSISTIKNGQVTIKLDDGSEINVKEADLDPDDGVRIETIASIDGISVADANFILNTLRTSTNASAQMDSLGAKEAYKYGFYGFSQDHIAKHGVFANSLTETQRQAIYETGQKARQRQVEKKQMAVSKKETTTQKKPGKVHFDGDINKLTDRQSASLTAMEKIADALGVQIYVFESEVNERGKRIGANGWYDPKDGSIHIDLHAGANGEGTMLFTAAHELTHFIRQWSPAKFKILADFLMQEYGKQGVNVDALVREQMAKAKRNGRTISYDTAYEEVVADSMETMLSDGNVMEKLAKLKQKDESLWQKIKDFINEMVAKVRAVYDGLTPDSVEGRYVAEMVDSIEKLQELFSDALVDASENYQSSLTPGEEGTMVNENGDPVAHATADGTIQLSMRTYEESGRKEFRKYLQKCVKNKRLTKAEMQEMLDGIEDIYMTCKEFKDKYAPFSSWSEAAVVRDTYGKPVFSVVTPNGDYKMNLDFSLVCKKRRTLDAVFNEMSKRGIIDDFELGQKSVVKINAIIRKYGLETACALCFVDAKRFRQASMADQFTKLYNELVLSLVPEEQRSSIDHFNFAGYETIKKVEGGIDTWDDSKLDFTHLDEVMKNYGDGTVEYKAAKYIKANAEGRKLLLRGDFMSSKGFDAVKTQNGDVLKLYNSKKGTGGPKAAFGDVQYMNEIIQKAQWWTPEKAYAVGGVRIQSFSDYVPRMVFDYVQMIYDLAATKLPAHAYTKEALFVKQFGLTGIKINMSLIPAIAEGGIAPGLDANGNYVWAGESFDYDTAKEIQNAEGYTENCGTICVGVSHDHIVKLLRDPNIRMVIPYHKSGLNPIVAHMNKIAEFHDYTNDQRTKGEDGKALENDFDFSKALHDMGENASAKAVASQYLKWCAENGYTPRFVEFAEEGNYYKLLEDFTLYDKDGNYVPQREVRAVFPKETDAFGSMKELIKEGLEEDAVVEGKRDSSLSSIVDEIQKNLPKTEAEISEDQVEQADRDLEADVKNSLRDIKVPTRTELEKKDPIKVVDIKTAQTKGTFAERRGQILKNAEKVISKPYLNRDTKTLIFLTKDSYTHAFKNTGTIQLNAAEHLPELIENAVLTHAEKPTHGSDYADGVYTFFAAARAGHIMPVKLKVKEYSYVGQLLPKNIRDYFDSNPGDYASSYDTVVLEVEEIEESSPGSVRDTMEHGIAPDPDELSTINVADLLGLVNGEYEKYIPKLSDRDNAPTFYSQMAKVVDGVKQNKLGASSVVNMLRGKGVKAEEIKWSGIEEWLAGKKSVTKAELQEFIAGSMLQIEEEQSGKATLVGEDGTTYESETAFKDAAYAIADAEGIDRNRVKFVIDTEDTMEAYAYVGSPMNQILSADISETEGSSPRWGQYKLDGGSNYREIIFKMPGSEYTNRAMRVHWGETTGVLAHARIQDLNTFLGKMLFIEEIQSDWHNEGHSTGYESAELKEADRLSDEAYEEYVKVRRAFNKYVRSSEFNTDPEDVRKKKFDWLRSKVEAAEKKWTEADQKVADMRASGKGNVPDAPFRDNYHEYVLKRLIREAAEQDYDSIGWTTAQIQSDRWSEQYAEGYRIEYDQDIPKFLNKYGKKWGTRVGKTVLDNGTEVWSMAITDSMKDSVLTEGQPLYSDRDSDGNQLSEDQQEFFKDSKVRDSNGNLIVLYHGTSVFDNITEFRTKAYKANRAVGLWLSDSHHLGALFASYMGDEYIDRNMETAEDVEIGYQKKGGVYKLYANLTNPLVVDALVTTEENFGGVVFKNYKQPFYHEIPTPEEMKAAGEKAATVSGEEIAIFARAQGYDGVIIKNVKEGYGTAVTDVIAFEPNQVKYADNRTPTSSPDIRYQDRDTESVSNRSLLANAFDGVAQNEAEKQKIQEYKGKISLINSEEQKLRELNEQIKELSFSKGPRDTKKIRDLQFEAKQTANRISTYDKQLLRLEASKPLQDVLTREKKMAYQRAEKKGKEALEKYREKATKTQRELLEKWQESRKKGIDSRNRTAMRHKIKDVVNELNQYLLHGTKDRHVPESLQKAVAEALDAVNMDTVGAEERIAKLQADMMKAKTPEEIQEISRKIDHIREMGDKMNGRLKKLKDAYDELLKSPDENTRNSYDEVIHNKLDSVIDKIGNTPLRDMTLAQLEDVYDMYRMVLTAIRDVNKSFKDAKKQSISTRANAVMAQVEEVGGKHKESPAILNGIKKFFWNNLKPVYAMEHIGSVTLTEAFKNVRAGEDVWAKDVTEAREFYLDKTKKYQYDSWDLQKQYKFQSTSGMDFSLNLEQILSLYAYSKRDQAADHLKYGGIVFDESTKIIKKTKLGISLEYNPTEATAYNISEETLADIVSKLTDDQKAFADEMQDYLSTVMGAKGNEVSMAMYDIRLFKDKNYFPLKSAQQFMEKVRDQQKGEVKIKNSGFSKETVPHAKNPIVLTPFMDVWSNHVNEMSMYHAFVLPLEDFYRIYNYKTPSNNETLATEGVNQYIQNAYGRGATAYIDQLLKDLNGGARTDPTAGIINKMMGLFKKGSVFASLSVVVQQPSAIARAAALVNTKYFIGPKVDHKRHKALWNEVKQYAPVAIIKEMGYFDTNMGKSTQDFITGKEYSGFKEKMKALVTDSNYRDEILSKAPALADELAWCSIWEAVKREMRDKHPGLDVKGEPFLMLAGSRFTEVITKTQVYDSVLSRSANMRSKDTGMKMATAFMAEPTTSINMITDALLQGKRGNKKYARKAIGSVIASQILNSILVSFVYAGRDDDEDETYVEKYIGTLTGEIIDSMNPATYIPFIKDIVSIVQGYDVERSDMSVISDMWKAWENLSKDNVSAYRKVEGFAGSIAQIFGLPVKNIMRDVRGIYQTVESFMNGQQTTKAGIGNAVKSSLPKWMGGGDATNQQQLYEAILSGDQTQISRVKSRYKDETAVNTAIRKALRENDTRIHEAAVAWNANDLDEYMRIAKQIIAEKHFSQDNVVMAIRAEANELKPDEDTTSTSKSKGLFTAEQFAVAISQGDQATAYAIKTDLIQTAQKNGKTPEEAEKSFNSSAKSELKELFLNGTVTQDQAINALASYCGIEKDDAKADVQYWAFKKDHPDVYADDSWFDKYYEEVADSGIAIEVYMDYRNQVKDITGEGKKEKRMAVINSMPISSAQKDALYYAEGWTASKLYEAPWH